ncbi:hypothetical protein PO909_008787, partial [Leuciscus waleckii]
LNSDETRTSGRPDSDYTVSSRKSESGRHIDGRSAVCGDVRDEASSFVPRQLFIVVIMGESLHCFPLTFCEISPRKLDAVRRVRSVGRRVFCCGIERRSRPPAEIDAPE